MIIFSIICSFVTIIMGLLHLALVLGAPIGEYVLGGKVKVVPINKRWINMVLFVIFISLGYLYLGNNRDVAPVFLMSTRKIIMCIYTVFLAYAVFGNIFLTDSKKEKLVMIPASIIGLISSVITIIYL